MFGYFVVGGTKYVNGQDFVLLLKFDLVNHERSYMWEKDSAWRKNRDG